MRTGGSQPCIGGAPNVKYSFKFASHIIAIFYNEFVLLFLVQFHNIISVVRKNGQQIRSQKETLFLL